MRNSPFGCGSPGAGLGRLTDIGETRHQRARVFGEALNSMNFHLVHVSTGAGLGASRINAACSPSATSRCSSSSSINSLPAEIGRVITELSAPRSRSTACARSSRASLPKRWSRTPVYLGASLPPVEPPPRELLNAWTSPTSHVGFPQRTRDRWSLVLARARYVHGRHRARRCRQDDSPPPGYLPREAGEIRWNGRVVEDPSVLRPPRSAFTPQAPPVQ